MSEIRTVRDIRELISVLDDDFKIELKLVKELDEDELKNMSYPYPYDYIECKLESTDIGYSDKVLSLSIVEKERN